MKLHILTACTRPENLAAMAESFRPAGPAGVDLVWHIRFDPDRRHVGGQALKNAMLDSIADGWVWIGDDDNIAHPDFFRLLAWGETQIVPPRRMLVSPQITAGGVRIASRELIKASHIDAAQAVIRRDAIGDTRIPEHYCGDGEFLEAIAARARTGIHVFDRPIVYYNALRGGQA